MDFSDQVVLHLLGFGSCRVQVKLLVLQHYIHIFLQDLTWFVTKVCKYFVGVCCSLLSGCEGFGCSIIWNKKVVQHIGHLTENGKKHFKWLEWITWSCVKLQVWWSVCLDALVWKRSAQLLDPDPCEKHLLADHRTGLGMRAEQQSKYLAVEGSLELQRTLSGWSLWVLNRLSGCWVIVDTEIPALWTWLFFAFACFCSPIECPL